MRATMHPVKRVERVRLYPTSRRNARLRYSLDVTRQLYNALLQERRDAYRTRGIKVTTTMQYAELTDLRAGDLRVAAVYRECEDVVLHRLDLAFAAFFRRLGRGENPGFPRFKPAARWKQLAFSHGDRALRFNEAQSRVRIPGVGSVRLCKGRAVPSYGRAWIVLRNARWYACFECERAAQPLAHSDFTVGVDRGVHLRAQAAAGPAQTLGIRPPFSLRAPAAC